jgi:dTDP-4-amino-4,6-dideoxygalactose transaminase
VGDAVAQRVMSLPMHPYISDQHQKDVVRAIRNEDA